MTTFNKDFKYDLEFGEIRERRVAAIIGNGKVEVKTERGQWAATGNIAIEYRYRGNPSGLTTSKAEFWWYMLEKDGRHIYSIVFPTDELKAKIRALDAQGKIRRTKGGDDNQSDLLLGPIIDLLGGRMDYEHQPIMCL